MSNLSSRSSSPLVDEELRLPRPPGTIRRFWARHPRFADIVIVLVCVPLTLAPTTVFQEQPIPLPIAVMLALLGVVASVMLLWRRKHPIVVVIAAYAVAAAYLLALVPVGTPLTLVALYSVAVYRSTRASWTSLAIGAGAIVVIAAGLYFLGLLSLQDALNVTIGEAGAGLIGALIGANVGGRKRYVEAIIDRSRQLLVERDQQTQLAAAAERDRIAREMHDILSHSLTVVVALSEGAAATHDVERARSASTAAATTARDALTEMRAMLGVVREGATDAPLQPLAPVSPHDTVSAAQRAGFPATLAVTGVCDVPSGLAFAIGRVVQEGMTNAMRHAPRASRISVRIDYAAEPLTIEMTNDGVFASAGADASASGGYGLRGLGERVALLGGSFVSEPAEPGRWMLRAELPRTRGVES